MKEALKLALDVLNESWHLTPKPDYVRVAITAIEAALAQPAQEPDNGDELTIAYMSGVHRGKELAAQPAQTVSLTSARYIADEDDDIQVYKRPWVGLTEAQFLEATRLAENGNYLVAFVRIQEWLKEQNT
jgi:hypothetical protein